MRDPFEELAYHQQGELSLVNHRHVNAESYELILVLSGGGTALIFDRTYSLVPGTLLLIDASYPHCVHPSSVGDYLRSKIIIEKEYLRSVLNAMGASEALLELFSPPSGRCLYLDADKSARADALFLQMLEGARGEDQAEKRLRLMMPVLSLLRLTLEALHTAGEGDAGPRQDESLSPVLKYLRERCAETLTVDQIAEDNHISKYYLCRLFRKMTGLTLMQYLYEQRLALARQQLTATRQSIGEIAQNCGFGSASHFCATFRRREGMSPREYRQKGHGGRHDLKETKEGAGGSGDKIDP